MIIAEENFFIAGEKADKFRENSVYSETMCGAQLKTGVTAISVTDAFKRLSKGLNVSEEAKKTFIEFFHKSRYDLCCLPKGHSGKCLRTYASLFPNYLKRKLSDCHTTPGNDDILFYNRAARAFPIQITKQQENNLRKEFGTSTKYRACVPIEFASTKFGCATAEFDIAALLTLRKVDTSDQFLAITDYCPLDIKEGLKRHAEYLVEYYAKEFNIKITNEGYLCCWSNGQIFDPELWCQNGQIQFGHVIPVQSDEYMTRGLNVLPMTKEGNMMQGEKNPEEFKQSINKQSGWLNG